MEITFNMTPEQQAADDARRAAWDAGQRQRTKEMTDAEFSAAVKQVTKAARPVPPVAGPHASTLTDAEYSAELRRLRIRKPRPNL